MTRQSILLTENASQIISLRIQTPSLRWVVQRNLSFLRILPLLVGVVLPVACASLALPAMAADTAKVPLSPTNVAPSIESPWMTPLQGNRKIAHVLNRLTYGPRPGDIGRVQEIGLDKWLEIQLNPQTIDDSAVELSIAKLPMLNAPVTRLALAYEGSEGTLTKLAATSKAEAQQNAANGMADGGMAGGGTAGGADTMRRTRGGRQRRVDPRRQAQLREAFAQSGLKQGASVQAVGELTAAKFARAIDSNRQLNEVLVDFWSNHFSVDVQKGPVRWMKILDDREVIRPRIWGSFRDLLGASAKSPAMLWYLDNVRSTAERQTRNGQASGGLNENYARELMELHTLGADGGYTQADVTEVARCFTGWAIGSAVSGEDPFRFNALAHDEGEKQVLGVTIAAGGGLRDGEKVLDILASHPSTAKFIARKLCLRFVADSPPADLVQKVADAFTRSNGDLSTVYRTLFQSPEFLSQGAYRSKIKSPFELAVSAVRALDGHYAMPDSNDVHQRRFVMALGQVSVNKTKNDRLDQLPRRPLGVEVAVMGQPLWASEAPTGYPENSASWVSPSALVSRLNFALSLTQGRIGDVNLRQDTFRPTTIEALAHDLLADDMSDTTKTTLSAEVKQAPNDGAKIRSLVLGSPDFQRR